jgi:hypothetical protein
MTPNDFIEIEISTFQFNDAHLESSLDLAHSAVDHEFDSLPGHTPGHSGFLVQFGDEPLLQQAISRTIRYCSWRHARNLMGKASP